MFVENVGRKKKFVFEIDEKYVDQKNHQMVTYIIGKAHHKKDIIFLKKLSDFHRKKNIVFLQGKKQFATNKNSRSPPRYLSLPKG